MSNFKKNNAETTTITRDLDKMVDHTGNIYETVAIIAKRSNQIAVDLKEELNSKLQEFASHTDNLEEVFENREQIEISRHYEKLPKPSATAYEEFMTDQLGFNDLSVAEEKES
jgi:DNA-directed RNA polymerase subunit K/omega